MCSQELSLTQLFMCISAVFLESMVVYGVFRWEVRGKLKIFSASAILRGIATTSTKEGCPWYSVSITATDMEMLTPHRLEFSVPDLC